MNGAAAVPRRILLITNPAAAAGQAQDRLDALQLRLRQLASDVRFVTTTAPGHAAELARTAADDFDLVLAAGGDGTVREVASGLLSNSTRRAALGILPLGTGNDVATQLGLADVDAALAALETGLPHPLDVIEARWVEGNRPTVQHALLFAAAGFAADLLRLTGPTVKRWFGQRLSYPVGFFRALCHYRPPLMRVRADGREFAGRMLHVGAGNSEWVGGGAMRLSPGARMDDGRIEFCLIEALGRLEVLWRFPQLMRGTFPGHPKVRYFPGRELEIESDPPVSLALDGDVVGQTPATFHILPRALRVLIPAKQPSSFK